MQLNSTSTFSIPHTPVNIGTEMGGETLNMTKIVLFCDLDNFILKFVSMCRKVSEVPTGYLLLVSFKIVRLAAVLLGTFKTFKTTLNYHGVS